MRIDQLVEEFSVQQPVVDDANRTDRDDFITAVRIEAGGFCVKYRVGQFGHLAVVQFRDLAGLTE